MIDATHNPICNATRRCDQNVGATYSGRTAKNTASFRVVTDVFGLFIDVGEPHVGTDGDVKWFGESRLKKILHLLTFNGQRLRVLGDPAYFSHKDLETDQIEYVPNRSEAVGAFARRMQQNHSKVRSSIERFFGLVNNMMKAPDAKFSNCIFVSDIPIKFLVNCLLMNARQIWYESAASGILSNFLPV